MNRSLWAVILCIGSTGITGCGSETVQEKGSTDAKESIYDNTLSDLLVQPRKELAAHSADWQKRVEKLDLAFHQGTTVPFTLLPELRFPAKIPVWQEAKFSESLGFSVPAYLNANRDREGDAKHLGHFGDWEAAGMLGYRGLQNNNTSQINRNNYPLEWTRMVALMQLDAEYRLAGGDTEGARDLISLHRQLVQLLDDRVKQSALGAALLGRGRTALGAAVLALKKANDADLAETIDLALSNWGNAPSPLGFLPWHWSKNQAEKLLGESAKGQAIIFSQPLPALDLLDLPAIPEGCQAVILSFDQSGKISEVLVTYRPRLVEMVTDAAQLTPALQGAEPQQPDEATANRLGRTYRAGTLKCEAILFPEGSLIGGLVRIGPADALAPQTNPALENGGIPREFGIVNLDRGFEQNRLKIAPDKQGDLIQTKRPEILAKVSNALDDRTPNQLFVHHEKGQDTVSKVVMQYDREKGTPPVHNLIASLIAKAGLPIIQETRDQESGSLSFLWQDSKTRLTLHVPNSESLPVELWAENTPDGRGSSVAKVGLDEAERKARIQAGKPAVRLPRQLDGVAIGQSRDQALAPFADNATVLKQDFPGGVSITFPGALSKKASSSLRQIIMRFDENQKVAEVSSRYQRGPAANPSAWSKELLNGWSKKAEAPAVNASPAALLWSDVDPSASSLKTYGWQDDFTRLTFEADGATAKVTLLDCPIDQPRGTALGDLIFLPLGPDRCSLGTSRKELMKDWQVTKPVTLRNVDLVLYPAKNSPYDALLVWFEGDKVSRVAARLRSSVAGKERISVGQVLTDTWGLSMKAFGWPDHYGVGADQQLTSMGTHDDRARVRVYTQLEDDERLRVFAEWKKIEHADKVNAARQ